MNLEDTSSSLGEPVKLEPGGIYAIECEMLLSREQIEGLSAKLSEYEKRYGIKFVVLAKGLKLARFRPEVTN